jgi:hypothetical protein
MSTLNVSNISDGTTSVGTGYVVNGSAKAWVDFNGSATATILDSNNIASLTDQGTGQYQFAFSNDMSSIYFAISTNTGNRDSSNAGVDRSTQGGTSSSSNFHYEICDITATSNIDAVIGHATIHGDLA